MASEIFTYSVMEGDKDNLTRIERIKAYAEPKGISMSWMVLKALKHYEETILNKDEPWRRIPKN